MKTESPQQSSDEDFLLISGAARLSEKSDQTIRNWVDSGELPAVRAVGGARLIRRSDLLHFLAERRKRRG